jgi:hypothetical protein
MLLGDFYYADIEYDANSRTATRLKICEPIEFEPGSFFWASRDQVINLINDGYTMEPFPKNEQIEKERHLVRLVTLDGQTYLRTDSAALPADRLNGHAAG